MYFAQEYMPLGRAVVISAGVAMVIIGVRAVTLMRFWLALASIVLPGVVTLAVTLVAAIWPYLQGILLTAEALGFFVAVMMLIPKIRTASIAPLGTGQNIPVAPAQME